MDSDPKSADEEQPEEEVVSGEISILDADENVDDDNSTQTTSGYTNQSVRIVKVVPLPHARSEVWSYFGFIADDGGEIQDKKKAICKICATTLSYSGNTTNLFTHLKAMHPEAKPQKLAPTNKTPRKGLKSGKRKFYETISGPGGSDTITVSGENQNGQYIIRAIAYPTDESPTNESSTNKNKRPGTNNCSSGKQIKTGSCGASVPPSTSSLQMPEACESHELTNESTVNVCSVDDITNAIVDMIVKDFRPVSIVEGKGFLALLKLLAPSYQVPETEELEQLSQKKYEQHRRDLILKGMGQM